LLIGAWRRCPGASRGSPRDAGIKQAFVAGGIAFASRRLSVERDTEEVAARAATAGVATIG
jgi:hypothetical protein